MMHKNHGHFNHSFEQPRSPLHNTTMIKQHLLLPKQIGFRLFAEIVKLNYYSSVPSYCICLHGLKLVLLSVLTWVLTSFSTTFSSFSFILFLLYLSLFLCFSPFPPYMPTYRSGYKLKGKK